MSHNEATVLCRHACHFTYLLYSSVENIFQAASSKPHPCDNVQCYCALYLPCSPQSSALQLWLRVWLCHCLSHNSQMHSAQRLGAVWILPLVCALFLCVVFLNDRLQGFVFLATFLVLSTVLFSVLNCSNCQSESFVDGIRYVCRAVWHSITL